MRSSCVLSILAGLILCAGSALAIDTTKVNLAETMPPDGTVTVTRVGAEMILTDGVTGAKTLADLADTSTTAWGTIAGTLGNQTDLTAALNAKAAGAGSSTDGNVALFSGTGGKTLYQANGFQIVPALGSVRFGSIDNNALGLYSIALGYNAVTSGTSALATGHTVRVGGDRSLGAGYRVSVYGDDSFAAGRQIRLVGEPSWGIGRAIRSTASNTMCINVGATTATMATANQIALMGGNVGVNDTAATATLAVKGSTYLAGAINTAHRSTKGAVPIVAASGAVGYVDTATSGTCLVVGSTGTPYWGARGGGGGGAWISGLVASTGSNATICSGTAPADGGFEIGGSLRITAYSGAAVSIMCDYTDVDGNAITNAEIPLWGPASGISFKTNEVASDGTGIWNAMVTGIYAKVGTTITLRTSIGGSATYNAQGWVKKM